jgi:predicted component of type VI protein secretion system
MSKVPRFQIDDTILLLIKSKVQALKSLIDNQRTLTEQLRLANKEVQDKELRDANGDAIEYAKRQIHLQSEHAKLTHESLIACKELHENAVKGLNSLDMEIKNVSKKIEGIVKIVNFIQFIYKNRATIVVVLLAIAGVISSLKTGILNI